MDLVIVMETIIRVSYKIMVWRTVSSFDIQKAMVNNALYGSVYSSIWHQVLYSNRQHSQYFHSQLMMLILVVQYNYSIFFKGFANFYIFMQTACKFLCNLL